MEKLNKQSAECGILSVSALSQSVPKEKSGKKSRKLTLFNNQDPIQDTLYAKNTKLINSKNIISGRLVNNQFYVASLNITTIY